MESNLKAENLFIILDNIKPHWAYFFQNFDIHGYQARRQDFPDGGSSTRIASRAPRGMESGDLARPPEAQGYLEQNPSI